MGKRSAKQKAKQAPTMPSFVTAKHREVGAAKALAAIDHLNEARAALDAACRDLCSVINANRFYRDIAKLSRDVHELRNGLDLSITIRLEDFALDREPRPDDFSDPHANGCGAKGTYV